MPAVKPIQAALENLLIDSNMKNNTAAASDASSSDAASCISSSADATKNGVKEHDPMVEPVISGKQSAAYYYGYCYPGFNYSVESWNEKQYSSGNGGSVGFIPAVAQADDASYFYYLPGFEHGYGPYAAADGQFPSQYPYYQSPFASESILYPGVFHQAVPFGGGPEVVSPYSWDPSLVYYDGSYGCAVPVNPALSSCGMMFSSGDRTIPPSSKLPTCSGASSKLLKSVNKMNGTTGYQRGYPAGKLETRKSSVTKSILTNVKELPGSYQNILGGDDDVRSNRKDLETSPVLAAAVDRNQYNLPDFPTKYEQALFFVIKSYSEDDIHKSIKYNVWASTPNGNKRLDAAFKLAQDVMKEKGTKCPVFLFFSVNASGQFCGVAEMVGPVDLGRSMKFWQQDKWSGYFPVKWHVVKDVPNPQLRHIILENNENKPVTNSRDTQEVNIVHGNEMLKIFKNYTSKTCILDDFEFYERRQRVMQDGRRGTMPLAVAVHPAPEKDKDAEASEQADEEGEGVVGRGRNSSS